MDEQMIWEINGVSLELDITDAETAERYENAIDELRKEIPVTGKMGLRTSAYIRAYCRAHRDMYDKIFYKGASEEIFKGIPDSVLRYNAIYAKLLGFVGMQSSVIWQETDEVCKKYLPRGGKKKGGKR